MAPQRTSRPNRSSRFVIEDDETPNSPSNIKKQTAGRDLGLSQVDSKYAIDPAGGTVVVMQDFHSDSARDKGGFEAVLSKAEKRKQLQLAKEAEERKRKDEEKRAAAAAKKAALEEAARREAEAKAAAEAAKKAEEEKKIKEEKERRKKEARDAKNASAKAKRDVKKSENKVVPPPAVPAAPAVPSVPVQSIQSSATPVPPRSAPQIPSAILHDPAVASIGSVISSKSSYTTRPAAPVVLATTPSVPRHITVGTQTEPVRVLPIEDNQYASLSSSSAAAWWLQQQQVAPPQAAYMEAMHRMTAPPPPATSAAPPQASNPYWQQPTSLADLYWQQQQPPRYPSFTPR